MAADEAVGARREPLQLGQGLPQLDEASRDMLRLRFWTNYVLVRVYTGYAQGEENAMFSPHFHTTWDPIFRQTKY